MFPTEDAIRCNFLNGVCYFTPQYSGALHKLHLQPTHTHSSFSLTVYESNKTD